MKKIAIIVPCYNEASRLKGDAFLKYTENEEDVVFIFVNDGSRDKTFDILKDLTRANPVGIKCVNLEINSGKAEAVRQGFLTAFKGDFNYIGYWDADLATPLRTVKEFSKILDTNKVDLVMGSRVKLLGRKIQRNELRHYLGRFFATVASFILGIAVYDTQCGAKLFRKTERLEGVFSKPFHVNWTFDVEIIARFLALEKNGPDEIPSFEKTTVEYPLEEWIDVPGSKIRLSDAFIIPIELIRIFFHFYLKGKPDV